MEPESLVLLGAGAVAGWVAARRAHGFEPERAGRSVAEAGRRVSSVAATRVVTIGNRAVLVSAGVLLKAGTAASDAAGAVTNGAVELGELALGSAKRMTGQRSETAVGQDEAASELAAPVPLP